MDRNQFVGLLLIGLLLFAYMFWQNKQMNQYSATATDSLAVDTTQVIQQAQASAIQNAKDLWNKQILQ